MQSKLAFYYVQVRMYAYGSCSPFPLLPLICSNLLPVAADKCHTKQQLLEWVHPPGGAVPAREQPVTAVGGLFPAAMPAATGAHTVRHPHEPAQSLQTHNS